RSMGPQIRVAIRTGAATKFPDPITAVVLTGQGTSQLLAIHSARYRLIIEPNFRFIFPFNKMYLSSRGGITSRSASEYLNFSSSLKLLIDFYFSLHLIK